MKYVANPVEVDAFKIIQVLNNAERKPLGPKVTGIYLILDSGEEVQPTGEMMSRINPDVGDYWVVQSDGYVYLNPKEVFERKYSPRQKADGTNNS